jgi:hypothetical protein
LAKARIRFQSAHGLVSALSGIQKTMLFKQVRIRNWEVAIRQVEGAAGMPSLFMMLLKIRRFSFREVQVISIGPTECLEEMTAVQRNSNDIKLRFLFHSPVLDSCETVQACGNHQQCAIR